MKKRQAKKTGRPTKRKKKISLDDIIAASGEIQLIEKIKKTKLYSALCRCCICKNISKKDLKKIKGPAIGSHHYEAIRILFKISRDEFEKLRWGGNEPTNIFSNTLASGIADVMFSLNQTPVEKKAGIMSRHRVEFLTQPQQFKQWIHGN